MRIIRKSVSGRRMMAWRSSIWKSLSSHRLWPTPTPIPSRNKGQATEEADT
jgi:hypothetical protein